MVGLPCCKDSSEPTIVVIEGKPNVELGVSIKGVRVEGVSLPLELQTYNTDEELWNVIKLDDGSQAHEAWKKMAITLLGETPRTYELFDIGRTPVRVMAWCSSPDYTPPPPRFVLNNGELFSCPVGDSITLEQNSPQCEHPETGPYTVISITERIAQQLDSEIKTLEDEKEELVDEIERLKQVMHN
jgi:hypothetical protein